MLDIGLLTFGAALFLAPGTSLKLLELFFIQKSQALARKLYYL